MKTVLKLYERKVRLKTNKFLEGLFNPFLFVQERKALSLRVERVMKFLN